MNILFATANPGKLREVRGRLEPLGHSVELLSSRAPDATLIEPQADDLRIVCEAKLAQALTHVQRIGLAAEAVDAVLVEDAGLFIDSLGGFPGVYSAFVHGTVGLTGVLRLMRPFEASERTAAFRCVIGLATDAGVSLHEGECTGRITEMERGAGGFGYDPIFVPDGVDSTFAEMSDEEKMSMSHRGRALDALQASLVAADS